jgi:hypothetical protein
MLALQKILGPVYGQPAWNVRGGHGSFLTFEMGRPRLEIRPALKPVPGRRLPETLLRRGVTARGRWHLWIYGCDWRVHDGVRAIGNSGSRKAIEKAARFLDGQALTRVAPLRRDGSCRFEFDYGGILETRRYDRESEQWRLYFPDRYVLTMGWDSLFAWKRGSRAEKEEDWQRVRRLA